VLNSLEQTIKRTVAQTKIHKDAFLIPALIDILQELLNNNSDETTSEEEIILVFAEKTTEALVSSPIFSGALLRALYRSILDLATERKLSRESILEELLFQNLKRPFDSEPTKRRKHKDARSKIMKAALDEFSERGYHATTVDSITDRAGVAKGTFYKYFNTKEGLFNALKEDTIGEFVEIARKDLAQKKDILELIEGVIILYLSFFENNSAFFKVITQEHKDFGKEFSEKFINELLLAFPALKRRCWKASRDGRLKQMNYFTVFFGIIGFLNGVIQKWLLDGAEARLLDEIDTVREVLFYGFVVQSGLGEKSNELRLIS
jgi:AcrR family transcriptional regulator